MGHAHWANTDHHMRCNNICSLAFSCSRSLPLAANWSISVQFSNLKVSQPWKMCAEIKQWLLATFNSIYSSMNASYIESHKQIYLRYLHEMSSTMTHKYGEKKVTVLIMTVVCRNFYLKIFSLVPFDRTLTRKFPKWSSFNVKFNVSFSQNCWERRTIAIKYLKYCIVPSRMPSRSFRTCNTIMSPGYLCGTS